jgi:DNA-binding response OmpR family regulator
MRILVVEDEVKVANALKEGLEDERYEAVVAHTGEDAFFRINTEQFDMIILDVMLPGRDGLQILTSIRNHGIQTPVLLLTARDTLEDRVAGLNSGRRDTHYAVHLAELLARIRALLR